MYRNVEMCILRVDISKFRWSDLQWRTPRTWCSLSVFKPGALPLWLAVGAHLVSWNCFTKSVCIYLCMYVCIFVCLQSQCNHNTRGCHSNSLCTTICDHGQRTIFSFDCWLLPKFYLDLWPYSVYFRYIFVHYFIRIALTVYQKRLTIVLHFETVLSI